MTGTHATATIWQAHYSYRKPRTETSETFVTGDLLVLTADPTGGDLLEVTKRLVLGAKPEPHDQFLLTHVNRIKDVAGMVVVLGDACGLRQQLSLARVELEAAKAELAAVKLVDGRAAP